MDKYGIDNVRGGSYTTIKLDISTKKHLEKISNSTNNKCFKCGYKGHFAKDCIEDDEDDDEDEDEDDDDDEDEIQTCFRCGREGHYVSSCYASKHIKGYYLN